MLGIKKTFNERCPPIERWPQNIKCLKWRGLPIKDNLEILNIEYLSKFNGRWPQNIKVLTETQGTKPKSKMVEIKTTRNGSWTQNIESWIF